MPNMFSSMNPFASHDPPPAPNVNHTANQQIAIGGQVQGMNAPPQTGIFGGTQYTYGPNGQVTGVNTSLNPQMQGVENTLLSGLGTRPEDVSNSVYGQYTARLDPQWDTAQKQLDDRLANQGIPQGSEAWNQAVDEFNRNKSAAYLDANRTATQAGGQEQSRMLGGLLSLGNASTAGYQNVPQIGTPNTAAMTYQNYLAQQDAYNQSLASQNAGMSGLFGLGSAFINAYGGSNG